MCNISLSDKECLPAIFIKSNSCNILFKKNLISKALIRKRQISEKEKNKQENIFYLKPPFKSFEIRQGIFPIQEGG